jgi:hypothetical protein
MTTPSKAEKRPERWSNGVFADYYYAYEADALFESLEAERDRLLVELATAKLEGFNEGIAKAAHTASYFSVKPGASIHPDIPWERMNENAKMIAHTTAQQISWAISELKAALPDPPTVADSKRGEE